MPPVELSVRTFDQNCLGVKTTIQNTKNSHVYLSELPEGDAIVVKRAKITCSLRLERFWKEVSLLQEAADCPHIVPILAVVNSAPNYCLAMPKLDRGSLFDLLHCTTAAELPLGLKLSLGLDFAKGVQFLHDKLGHVSRDIKPSNCIVGFDWRAVLCDLEHAESLEVLKKGEKPAGPTGGYYKKFMVGTMVYMAPELLEKHPFTTASDVYSFGISLNEILTGTVPYSDVQRCDDDLQFHTIIEASYSQQALMQAVVTKGLRPHVIAASQQFPDPEGMNQLIGECWSVERGMRPAMDVVCVRLQEALSANPGPDLSWKPADLSWKPAAAATSGEKTITVTAADASVTAMKVLKGSAAAVDWTAVFAAAGAGAAAAAAQTGQTTRFTTVAGHEGMPGRRGADNMEDRSFVFHEIAAPHASGVHLFGVFDGHGGAGAAEFAKQHMLRAVLAELAVSPTELQGALQRAFVAVDKAFAVLCEPSGATALVTLVVGDFVLIANAGDCRAVLSRAGTAVQLTQDHTASLESEKVRVLEAGGSVQKAKDGKLRLGGRIQVTRAIGDTAMKVHGMVAEPEVTMFCVGIEDDFLLVATDGVWDVVTNQAAVLDVTNTARGADLGAKSLCMRAWSQGSNDNISVVCVCFNHDGVDYAERATTRVSQPVH